MRVAKPLFYSPPVTYCPGCRCPTILDPSVEGFVQCGDGACRWSWRLGTELAVFENRTRLRSEAQLVVAALIESGRAPIGLEAKIVTSDDWKLRHPFAISRPYSYFEEDGTLQHYRPSRYDRLVNEQERLAGEGKLHDLSDELQWSFWMMWTPLPEGESSGKRRWAHGGGVGIRLPQGYRLSELVAMRRLALEAWFRVSRARQSWERFIADPEAFAMWTPPEYTEKKTDTFEHGKLKIIPERLTRDIGPGPRLKATDRLRTGPRTKERHGWSAPFIPFEREAGNVGKKRRPASTPYKSYRVGQRPEDAQVYYGKLGSDPDAIRVWLEQEAGDALSQMIASAKIRRKNEYVQACYDGLARLVAKAVSEKGATNVGIADALGLGESTVRNLLKHGRDLA